jgi:hypothetical protein
MTNGDSTPWAYCHANAVFDNNDYLHISWQGHMAWKQNDTLYYGDRAKIFHWDEVSDSITVVNSPSVYYNEPNGWWLQRSVYNPTGEPGAWRIQADQPQLVVGNGDTLYCLWHGNDDTTDVSAAGYNNGEFYGAYSPDNGLTWSDYVNLTNTRSPGAPAGACMDEDYMTANPFVVDDSLFITYIEDKDAGEAGYGEGVATENPVRCWVFPTSLITGIKENALRLTPDALRLEVYPNPFSGKTAIKFQIPSTKSQTNFKNQIPNSKPQTILKIYDATGRLVRQWDYRTMRLSDCVVWNGTDDAGHRLPAGVYFVRLETGGFKQVEKVILLR